MELQPGEIAPSNNPKINKIEPPVKTWFFERPDGTTFGCHNNEAWNIINRREQNVAYRNLKLIGCSDGSKFRDAVAESHRVFREEKNLEKAQEIIRQGEQAELESARGHIEMPFEPGKIDIKLK